MLRQILHYFPVLIFFSVNWTSIGYCTLSEYLEPDIIEILMDTRQEGFYTVRVLEGEVESSKRLLLILGENRFRTPREKAVADQVLSKFSCIGHANMDCSKTWGGVCFKWWRDTAIWGSRLSQTASKLFHDRMDEIPVAENSLVDVRTKASLEHFSAGLILALERYFNHIENYPETRLCRLVLNLQELSEQSKSPIKMPEYDLSYTGSPETWGGVCFKWWRDTAIWGSRLSQTASKLFHDRMDEIPVAENSLVDVRAKASLEHFSAGLILALERYFNHIENYPETRLCRLVLKLQELTEEAKSLIKLPEYGLTYSGSPESFREILKACDFSGNEVRSEKLNRSQLNLLLFKLANHPLLNHKLHEKLQSLAERIANTQDATEEELITAGYMNIPLIVYTYTPTVQEQESQLKSYTFSLEEGHTPGLIENLTSIYLPTATAARVGMLGAYLFGDHLPDSVKCGFYTVGALVFATDLLNIGTMIFSQDQRTPLFFVNAFITGRNQTMAKNILKTLKQRPQEKILLGIMGKSHVDGIVDLLKRDGFTEQVLICDSSTEK